MTRVEAGVSLVPLTAACLFAASIATTASPVVGSEKFTAGLSFPVIDDRPSFRLELGRDIVVVVTRAVDAHGIHFGWDLSAVDRRLPNSSNFFYDCRCGHGPRPHDLYAWHFADHYYPAERVLPVYGYPFEVRVRCIDCRVEGPGATETHFTAGTVEVGWRRLAAANPRQQR